MMNERKSVFVTSFSLCRPMTFHARLCHSQDIKKWCEVRTRRHDFAKTMGSDVHFVQLVPIDSNMKNNRAFRVYRSTISGVLFCLRLLLIAASSLAGIEGNKRMKMPRP